MMSNVYSGVNTNSCIVTDNSGTLTAGWHAVKVQYNPSNDEWRMFTRLNVAQTFDPTTLGQADGRGSKVDNTHTSKSLMYMGIYGCMPPDNNTYGARRVALDRLKIKKNVALITTPAGGCSSFAALPVEFNQFTVNCNNSESNLKWSTFTESNNDYFTIERSSDGLECVK
jgi:hypothetical protein